MRIDPGDALLSDNASAMIAHVDFSIVLDTGHSPKIMEMGKI
jgi:hypothetical protein